MSAFLYSEHSVGRVMALQRFDPPTVIDVAIDVVIDDVSDSRDCLFKGFFSV